MTTAEIIGFIAGALTSIGFLPQFIKAYRTKSTRDISLPMLLIILTGVILWLIYGIMEKAMPVVAANGVTMFTITAILMLKVRYK